MYSSKSLHNLFFVFMCSVALVYFNVLRQMTSVGAANTFELVKAFGSLASLCSQSS